MDEFSLKFGRLFKGLGGFLDLVARMEREGREEVREQGQINLPGGHQGIYGVSVRLGLGGKPVIEPFGHVGEEDTGTAGTALDPVREPLTDVFDEGDLIVVVTEIPGVSEKTVDLQCDGHVLTLKAGEGQRRYAKEVRLPAAVSPEPPQFTCRNGILEVRLAKRKGPADP